jgi:acetyl esterase/lipase
MPSWQSRIANAAIRLVIRPALGDLRDIARMRRVFARPLPTPKGVVYRQAVVGGVAGEWVTDAANNAAADAASTTAAAAAGGQPKAAASTTLLYLHGGGFVACSPTTHRALTAALALQGLRVFAPDYRLAPEHPFPAAITDAVAVWRALGAQAASQGHQRLVIAGDSAGGNLALATMLALRDAALPLPQAAALFSPATDLTGGSPSLKTNDGRDPMFRSAALRHVAEAYLAGADPKLPLASPLLADLSGLPPLLIHVGADEVLRDDSVRLADRARAAGVRVELRVWPGLPHVWQMLRWLPEARESVRVAARHLRGA